MKINEKHDRLQARCVTPPQARRWRWSFAGAAILLTCVATVAAAQNGQQTNSNSTAQDAGRGRAWTTDPKVVIPETETSQQKNDAANAERRKQIADDSAQLLKMATDLKAEVDKTTKDTLSLGVIRKADEIEKLAHAVKEKMKLSTGAARDPS